MIRTERLCLRRFQPGDSLTFLADPEVVRFEPYPPLNEAQQADALAARIQDSAFLAIEFKGAVIGNLYLGAREFGAIELGYALARAHWRKGFAKEAASAVIQAAFASGAHRIYAECDPENEASWRLLESLGFAREAHFRKNVYFKKDSSGNPIWKDTLVYSLLNE